MIKLIRQVCSATILAVTGGKRSKSWAMLLAGGTYICLAATTGLAIQSRYAVDEHPQQIAADTWRFMVPVGVRPVGTLYSTWSQYDFASATQGIEVDYAFDGAGIDFADHRTFSVIAPGLSDQIDGYVNGWGGGGMADGTFGGVVYATAPLTSVHFGIEADRLMPVLRFPLRGPRRGLDRGLTAESATINAVFDHSMADQTGRYAPYGHDQIVTAYTGESGAVSPSGRHVRSGGGGARGRDAAPRAFEVNGHYSGWGDPRHLYVDGHPGVDYRVALGTEVYAAASGTIRYPTTMVDLPLGNQASSLYHVLELIPDAAPNVRVYYLHLSTHPAAGKTVTLRDKTAGCPSTVTLPLPEGSHVEAGCLVALSGHAGPKGTRSQLHFEVQTVVPLDELPLAARDAAACPDDATAGCVPIDPYGWQGDGADPFESLTGVANTRLWQ